MSEEYDYIIIGGGISGCYVSNHLIKDFPSANILLIDRNSDVGGVWHQTKWSWLSSDTPAAQYCSEEVLQEISNKYMGTTDGISKSEILNIVQRQTKYINKVFNTTVKQLRFNTTTNIWKIYTNRATYLSRFIINCTGTFQNPSMPNDITTYLSQNNVIYCHSSQVTDIMIEKNKNIAVIGSRESGVQIVKGISQIKKVDWYARHFNNLYCDLNHNISFLSTSYLFDFLVFMSKNINYLFNIQHVNNRTLRNSFSYYIMFLWLAVVYNNIVLKNMLFNELFNSYRMKNFLGNYNNVVSKPILFSKPVLFNSNNIIFSNIKVLLLKNNEQLKKYDLVILATGYEYKEPFSIFVNDEERTLDLFYLVNYIKPHNIPQMLCCIPYSPQTYIDLHLYYDKLKTNLDNQYVMVSDREFNNYKNEVDKIIKLFGITDREMYYNVFKLNTLIFLPFLIQYNANY